MTSKDEVCIELDIPEHQVLLSDFESWHFVLNNWYYSDVTNEKEWRDKNRLFEGMTPKRQRFVKEQSWQRIFNVTPRHGEWTKNGESVQACFWYIGKKQIRKVWRLKAG